MRPEVDMEACRIERLPLRVLAQNKVHHFRPLYRKEKYVMVEEVSFGFQII